MKSKKIIEMPNPCQGCLGIYSDVALPVLNTAETDKTCETSATVYMYCISAEAEEIHAPTPIPVFEAVSQRVFTK